MRIFHIFYVHFFFGSKNEFIENRDYQLRMKKKNDQKKKDQK